MTSAAPRSETAARAGQAGLLATLLMLAVQLIWRLNWSENGVVQAFPEFVVAAVARLTPLSVFGAATENYGSLAKKTLFVSVLLGIVAVGFRAGDVAGRLSGRIGRGVGGPGCRRADRGRGALALHDAGRAADRLPRRLRRRQQLHRRHPDPD